MKSFQIATLFIALLFAIAHAIPNKISATRMFAQKIQVSHVSEHKDTTAGQALLRPHKQSAGGIKLQSLKHAALRPFKAGKTEELEKSAKTDGA